MNNNGGVCPANFPHLDALWFGDDTHPSSIVMVGSWRCRSHVYMDIEPQSWWFILSVLKCQTTPLECSAEGLQFKRKWRGTPLVNHLVIWIGVNFQPNSLKVTHRWDHHTFYCQIVSIKEETIQVWRSSWQFSQKSISRHPHRHGKSGSSYGS